MTVNLTLNDITAKGASEVLKLIQSIEAQPAEKLKPTKQKPKNTDAVTEETPSTVSEVEELEKPDEKSYTAEISKIAIEYVRSAFAKFAKANGKDAAKEILEKFGANKVTELKETDYGAIMKALGEE